MAKWTEEQKQTALTLSEVSTCREAAEQTGIPEGTIKRWRKELKESDPNNELFEQSRTERTEPLTVKKVKDLAVEAVEDAKIDIREYVVDRTRDAADQLIQTVTISIKEIQKVIEDGPNEDEPKAAWLRSIVGAMAQSVEKYQLLTGKPTSRQSVEGQVTKREEYYIEQRLKSDPESAELLRQLYRRRRAVESISQN